MKRNRFGLDRYIDAATRRAVRQRCGFGCVCCGSVIIDYHHFHPPFVDAVTHDPNGITLLCGSCHNLEKRGIIDLRTIAAANASPSCKQTGHTKNILFNGDRNIPVRFGSSRVRAATVLMYDDRVVLGLSPPERAGSPLRLNAVLTDDSENEVMRIVDNEWQFGIDRYDICTTSDMLTVRDALGDIVLQMSLATGTEIRIRRLRMRYLGFSITADKDSFSLVVPSGGEFRHVGDVVADVGIWMKSTGQALVAANALGGAAICIGPSKPDDDAAPSPQM